MKHIIDPAKHKFIIISIAILVSFFGFEAASLAIESYQIANFLVIAVSVYLFLIFWQSVVFDLHLKKHRVWENFERRFHYFFEGHHGAHFYNFLVLPGIIYWAIIALLFLNPFDTGLKQITVLFGTAGLALAYWYMKTVFYGHKKAHRNVRQVIFIVKLFASYVSFAAVFGLTRYFGLDAITFAMVIFGLVYLLIHQVFFQYHYIRHNSVQLILLSGLVTAQAAAVVFTIWNVNFYSGALVISAVYNTIWGIIQHKYIDKNLQREIVYEYLAVLFVILVIVFSTTNFSERLY